MNQQVMRTTSYTATDHAAADLYAAAYAGWGVTARYHHSRLHAISQQLEPVPGGTLLDVGCGPGLMARHLLETRPGDFEITALDQSPAMVEAAERGLDGHPDVDLLVAGAEAMPLPTASFDVVLGMGVLEYTDLPCALREIARVARPGARVIVTMLNPLSPYRLVEWGVYWPGLRMLGELERVAGVPQHRRHGCPRTGIRALTPRALQRCLRSAGLEPVDLVHYDVTPTVPPLDRLARKVSRGWRDHPETTLARGARSVLGTAYLVACRRAG